GRPDGAARGAVALFRKAHSTPQSCVVHQVCIVSRRRRAPVRIAPRSGPLRLPAGAVQVSAAIRFRVFADCGTAPQACFLFIEGNPAWTTEPFRRRLRGAFGREGLDFERFVTFLPRMSPAQFNGLLKKIDIAIDTIGWTGGNTTIQTLES